MLSAQARGTVYDLEGKELGRVDRLLIDLTSSRIASVVVALPATASAAERFLTVPWEAVGFDPERGAFLLNLPLDSLLEAFDAQRRPQPDRPAGTSTEAE